jgi:hypothetical protein
MNSLKNMITFLIYTVKNKDDIPTDPNYTTTFNLTKKNENYYTIIITMTDNKMNNTIKAIKTVENNNDFKTVIIEIEGKTWNDKLREWNKCGYKNIDRSDTKKAYKSL